MVISVIIPLFNKAKTIERAVQSILRQTYQDFEIILVDDGSTDDSVSIVARIEDNRIKIIRQANGGVSSARNKGIQEAKGNFIALLDGDDEWHEDYLETQLNLTNDYPDCDVFVTNYQFKDERGRLTPTTIRNLPFKGERGELTNYFEVASSSHPPIHTITIMVRRGVYETVGGFPIGVTLGEDLITWAKLSCRCRIAYTRKVCATYYFDSAAARIVNDKCPDRKDLVGESFKYLLAQNNIPKLKDTAALWHKMRMVMFLQFGNKDAARDEFKKICGYIHPGKKDIAWAIISYLPQFVINWILVHK